MARTSRIADSLHPNRYKQIHLRIFALQSNPRPLDAEQLEVDVDVYRVRVGPYLITYRVDDARRRIVVYLLEEIEPEE